MIRPARKEDADIVVPLIVQALVPGAFQLTESGDEREAYPVVKTFFLQEINRHSYNNTLVYDDPDFGVIGSIVFYDGADEMALAKPINHFLMEYYKEEIGFDPETQDGEYYIDTVSVNKHHQGKKIGQQLILAACEIVKARGVDFMGLIVDLENPAAKRLYGRLGFMVAGTKQLWGHTYEHMQKKL